MVLEAYFSSVGCAMVLCERVSRLLVQRACLLASAIAAIYECIHQKRKKDFWNNLQVAKEKWVGDIVCFYLSVLILTVQVGSY